MDPQENTGEQNVETALPVEGQTEQTSPGNESSSTETPPELGDAGTKALRAVREERNAARAEARQYREQLEALQAQIDGREAEHAAAREAQQAQEAFLAEANARISRYALQAAASGKLADPADAVRFVDADELEGLVNESGDIDGEAAAVLIDRLLADKPYLGAQANRWEGSVSAGSRGRVEQVRQVTESELVQMSTEQINQARREGRLDHLMGKR